MRNRPWSYLDEQHARKLHKQGYTYREIGDRLGRTREAVVGKLNHFRPKTDNCVDCNTAISANTKTGRCRKCKNAYIGTVPEYREAKAEAIRRKWREDPCYAAKMRMLFRQIGRENGTNPERRAKLVAHGHRMKATLHSPESVAKRDYKAVGAKLSERKIGWCPVEYRDEYKRLTTTKRLHAAEAKAIILEQVKADLAKLSPFERQMRSLEKGARVVANDQRPSLANPGVYETRRAG